MTKAEKVSHKSPNSICSHCCDTLRFSKFSWKNWMSGESRLTLRDLWRKVFRCGHHFYVDCGDGCSISKLSEPYFLIYETFTSNPWPWRSPRLGAWLRQRIWLQEIVTLQPESSFPIWRYWLILLQETTYKGLGTNPPPEC